MKTILLLSFIYFLLGILSFALTMTNEPNWFSKKIVKLFKTLKDFNKAMFYFWLIPIIITIVMAMIYSVINS